MASLGLLALALACLPAPALAQDSLGEIEEVMVGAKRIEDRIELADSLTVYGHVQATASTNLARPDRRRGANAFRLAHPDHNALSLTYAKLGVARTLTGANEFDAGFRFEVGAGRLVTEAMDDPLLSASGLTIPQAYVDLQIPTPVTPVRLRMGRQYGWFGTESLDLYSNPNASLSVLSLATPRTVTGASLSLELGQGLSYSQFVVQGWDQVEDLNDAKTLGGQLRWEGRDLNLALNWILGAEQPGASSLLEDDLRWAVELAGRYRPLDGLELRGSLLYGQETFADDTARFWGASLALEQGLFEVEGEGYHRLTLAARGSFLRDQGGSRTGLDQTLGEVTATFGLHLSRNAALRAEYRHDFSSVSDAFNGDGGQDTLTLAFEYHF